MAPEDRIPSDLRSETGANSPAPVSADLQQVLAQLTARVDALEQAIADLTHSHTTGIAAPPPGRQLPAAGIAPIPPTVEGSPETSTPPPPRSLEDRLGSQIFNRIAIVAILIGAALGLKLAIDNHWVGPLGRIMIGLIAGSGLIVWSERFRRREFAAFSYSLKAVGTGVLYLSLWASFQLYHLLPAGAVFALMLLVTLWNVWMAWSQQSEVLAAYAIAGAFSTPALVSTGGNHQVFLFSYLLSIDIAALALVRLAAANAKRWSRLLVAVIPSTIVYFIGWYSRFYNADQLVSTSVFITLFFAAFFTVPFRNRIASSSDAVQTDPIADVLLPLTNATFASLAFYSVLQDSGNHAALPWVALLFAAIYAVPVRPPLLARMQTAAARGVHLSLAVLFLTITIPLKASGRWMTIGWLAEGIALLWVSARLADTSHATEETGAGIHSLLRRLASVALALGFLGLLITPYWLDRSVNTAIFNRRFATELAGILGLGAAAWISLRAMASSHARKLEPFPIWQQLAGTSIVALNIIALQSGITEIQTFWTAGQAGLAADSGLQTALSISAFLMLYGAGLLAAGFVKHSAFLRWQGLGLLVVAILKTFLYDVRSLSQGYRVASFLGLGALLMAVSFAYVRKNGKASNNHP